MSNVLLAALGGIITMIVFAGFSVYQLEKTAAQAGRRPAGDETGPGADHPAIDSPAGP
jgi:hypothetical protein